MGDVYGFGRPMRDGDFEEEEVWAVMKERKEGSPMARKAKDTMSSSAPRRLPTSSSRPIPKSTIAYTDGNGGGSGSVGRVFQQSAPVNIPDWSKIYKNKKAPSETRSLVECDYREATSVVDADDYDDDDDDKIPPHEWVARKLARSQISSFSVCEGAGRTLKGRDLSKVRNAVLTRTGFLEQ